MLLYDEEKRLFQIARNHAHNINCKNNELLLNEFIDIGNIEIMNNHKSSRFETLDNKTIFTKF